MHVSALRFVLHIRCVREWFALDGGTAAQGAAAVRDSDVLPPGAYRCAAKSLLARCPHHVNVLCFFAVVAALFGGAKWLPAAALSAAAARRQPTRCYCR